MSANDNLAMFLSMIGGAPQQPGVTPPSPSQQQAAPPPRVLATLTRAGTRSAAKAPPAQDPVAGLMQRQMAAVRLAQLLRQQSAMTPMENTGGAVPQPGQTPEAAGPLAGAAPNFDASRYLELGLPPDQQE